MTTFIPANDLETALESARAGRLPMPDFLKVFVASDLAVPSGGEVQSDGGGFQPVLFDKAGVQMVACFTDKERFGEFTRLAPYCLVMNGGAFLRRVPRGYGVVINPGQEVGFEINPEGLSKIVADFV